MTRLRLQIAVVGALVLGVAAVIRWAWEKGGVMAMWWFGYPNGLQGWIKDFRLGWDQDDLRSAIAKITTYSTLTGICYLTHRELQAVKAEALARSSGKTLVTPE